jgi:hypothetical protein
MFIAGSSNGRTQPSGGWYWGSNPYPAANQCTLMTVTPGKARKHLQNPQFLTQTFVPHARCPEKGRKTGLFGEL